MKTSTASVTADQLHAMFRKHYPEQTSEALWINAEVITENHPQMASLILRIDGSGMDKTGRAASLVFIGDILNNTSVSNRHREDARPATPHETRDEATYLWDHADTKNNLMRAWALTNAAQETGTPIDEFLSRKRETMCERFHERYIAPLLHAPDYDFRSFWHDSFYAEEYWRGLAAFCIIGEWYAAEPSYAFILWAGQQDDLTAITEIAMERHTINTDDIAALLEYRDTIGPALWEGAL